MCQYPQCQCPSASVPSALPPPAHPIAAAVSPHCPQVPAPPLPAFPAAEEDDGADAEPDTRAMVRAQNQKKKKSGGFQSMGACGAGGSRPGTGTVPSCPRPLTCPRPHRPQLPRLQGHHEEGLQGAHPHPEEGEWQGQWDPHPGVVAGWW